MQQTTFLEFAKARGSCMVAVACCLMGVPATADPVYIPSTAAVAPLGGARVTGEVTEIGATAVQLALRNGRSVTVDLTAARANHQVGPIVVGEYLMVQGSLSGAQMTAIAAVRARSNPNTWMPDLP